MYKECKKGFSIEFMLGYDGNTQRFSSRFVWGPLKEHREDILLDQIMARLPTFQLVVTEQLAKERYREKMTKIEQRVKEIQLQNAQIVRNIIVFEEYDINKEELYQLVNKNKLRLTKLFELRDDLTKKHSRPTEKKDDEEKRHKTHGNCLNRDKGCNGFINHEWECGICFMKVCSKCHSIKEKEHECDPNEVESIKALKEISKPCPGCNQMIERTHGCSQMWCTNCRNFFDWNSLKIIKKTQYVHNPEHVAWLAKNSKMLGNVGAPAEVNACDISYQHITSLFIPEEAKEILTETLRICNEIRDEIDHYRDPLEKNIEKHAVEFLRGKITKNDLKKLVQRNYKSSKKTEFANMHRMMYIDNVRNILVYSVNEIRRLSERHTQENQAEKEAILQNTFTVLNNLREYTEKNLKNLGELFNSEKPHLSNTSARSAFNGKKYANQFIRSLQKLRTERFYIDYSSRQIFYKLTGTKEEKELIKFLKEHSDWIPTEEDILKAKKEYDSGR
jgi:arsenate reductase-like glutaredoxin family protein